MKKAKTKAKVYVLDLETNSNHSGDIYRWAIRNIYDDSTKLTFGWDITDLMKHIYALQGDIIIYAHNGGGFDWHYILNWLVNNKIKNKDYAEDPNTWTALIDDSKNIYEIKLNLGYSNITFWDSYKLTNSSLASMGHNEKDLWKPEMVNEWNKQKLLAYPTKMQLLDTYLALDVNVVADLLKEIYIFTKGQIYMTAASTAMTAYKKIADKIYKKNLHNQMTITEYDLVKKFYRGGFTYGNPLYKFKHTKANIYIYDVNSLYPSVMMSDKIVFPIGQRYDLGFTVANTDEYPVQFVELSFMEAKVKTHKHPWIQTTTRRYGESSYDRIVISKDKDDKLVRTVKYLSLEEYTQFLLDYTFKDLRIDRVHGYKGLTGKEIFGDYVNIFKTLKETSKGAIRTYAKIMLNSLYGKFGSNPERDGYHYVNEQFEIQRSEVKDRNIYHTMIAAKITSEARLITIRAMQANADSFVYADTDSLHLLNEAIGLELDDNKFGAWKFENVFDEFKYAGQKRYLHSKNNQLVEIKCGGLNKQFHNQLNYENFANGMVIKNGKLILKPLNLGEIPLARYRDFTFIDYEI